MKPADDTRWYAKTNYIDPARATGASQVSIRAGDLHHAMGYTNRLPAVIAALGALKFQSLANVELLRIDGPLASTTTTLTFGIL